MIYFKHSLPLNLQLHALSPRDATPPRAIIYGLYYF